MRHRSLWLIVLLIVVGCGDPEPLLDLTPRTESDAVVVPVEKQPAAAEPETTPTEFTAKVIGIIDGDTIDVLTDHKETIRIRLNGIDAPERGQGFGNNA